MNQSEQKKLAEEMLAFLESSPLTEDLQWTKDPSFLFHFEAARQLIVRDLMNRAGVDEQKSLKILDFGFLHGLVPEFLHRAYPNAAITVCDLPSSPIFQNQPYLEAIRSRKYLKLLPLDMRELSTGGEKYDVISLGEVIEHLDPTQVANSFANLKNAAASGAVLLITTPNAAGLYNCYMTMRQRADVQVAPIPDKTFGYGHIHLWSPNTLIKTAEHFGWKNTGLEYYHGREGEMFERGSRAGATFKERMFVNIVRYLTERNPSLRGFFVASFRA